MKQYFALKLQELRKEHGLSQEALAEILDVSRQSVSKWESGRIYPEIDKIIFLSEYFNVSIDELLKEPQQQDIKSKRKIINLSKPPAYQSQTQFQPEEQDIMPYAYKEYKSYKIPPVQPAENVNIVNGNQAKSKKKIKSGKKNLSTSKVLAIVFSGSVLISCIITSIYETWFSYNTNNDVYVQESVYEDEYDDKLLSTAVYVDDDGNVTEYEYDADEILNRIFYYYDKDQKKYIPVLVPFEEYLFDYYLMQTANVYISDMCAYVDVINFTDEFYHEIYYNDAGDWTQCYTDDDVTFARYYCEQFEKYIQVLIPPCYSINDLEGYGYKMIDIYESDGGIYKTIIKDE
jgi:transcriptional regulator with XRE-family HTH domain